MNEIAIQARSVRWLRGAARASGAVTAIIGVIALVGWFGGMRRLASIGPDFIPMAPNTAIGFIVLGIALWPLTSERKAVPIVATALVGALALVSLIGYIARWDVGVDQWIFRFPAERLGLAPVGRMALFTAICFVCISIAVICTALQQDRVFLEAIARVLAVIVGFVGLMFALGYLYGKPLLYGGQQIPMALNTAASFFLLGLALSLLGIAGDIAERKRAAAALAESEERHRVVVQQAADGITLVDAETLRIIEVNQAFASLLGYTRDELIGQPIADFIVDTAQGVAQRAQQTLGAGAPTTVQRQYRRRDGTLVDVEKSATVLEMGGRRVMCTVIHDITRRIEAERLLRASEARGRLIIETANDAFISMDSNGKIIDWNPQAEAIFGWKREEAIRRVLAETIIPPRFRAAHEAGLRTFLTTGVAPVLGKRLELFGLNRAGEEFPIEITISRVRDGDRDFFVAFVHDITARKQAEEQRDRIFTLSLDMVCVGAFDGYFKRVNHAFETTLGYTEEEMLSKPWIEFVHPDDRAVTAAEGEKMFRGATVLHFENRYQCKDRSYKWLSWTCVPVVKDELIYAIARDMTERKRIEQELADTARSEREAHLKLKDAQVALVQTEKLASLGQMVAGVAHEINNPLAFVSNNVAVLERDAAAICEMLRLYANSDPLLAEHRPELAQQIRELSDRIDLEYTLSNVKELTSRSREGLRRIQQIVKDLRDFARLDQAAVHDADLNAGIESTVNIITGLAKKKCITIERNLENIPLITCQPAKINQVVMNLLSNAIDACDEAGTVTIHTSTCDNKVNIEVADTGHGIAPAIRARIFDPFFTTKPPGAGTGLGLSISYGIIQEHGGRIDVNSTPGKGSTFVISLPIKKS